MGVPSHYFLVILRVRGTGSKDLASWYAILFRVFRVVPIVIF